jgi:hypothetical protein
MFQPDLCTKLMIVEGRLTEQTVGRLWEFGDDGDFPFEQSEKADGYAQSGIPSPTFFNRLPPKELPLGIRAKQMGIQAKRMRRWDNIYLYLNEGLTQEQMADREDIAVRTIKADFEDMRAKGVFPLD